MSRPRNPDKRLKKLSAPATATEVDDYQKACKKLELEPADTLRKLARALVKSADENGFIAQPIRLAPPPAKQR